MRNSKSILATIVSIFALAILTTSCNYSPPPIKEEEPIFTKKELRSIDFRGERFEKVSIFSEFDGGCSMLRTCFIGTVNDTLFGIRDVGRQNGCLVPYPILCWKDSLDHGIFYYNSEAARNCSGDSSAYIERFSGQVVGYVRVEDEHIYLVRHTILANVHSKLEQLNFDDRWPDMNRKPQKTYVVSSKSGIVGVFTNGIGLDWFPL